MAETMQMSWVYEDDKGENRIEMVPSIEEFEAKLAANKVRFLVSKDRALLREIGAAVGLKEVKAKKSYLLIIGVKLEKKRFIEVLKKHV